MLLAVRTLLPGLFLLLLASAKMLPDCPPFNYVQSANSTEYIFVFDRDIPNDQMEKYKYVVKGMSCELNYHESIKLVVAEKKGKKIDLSRPMSIPEFHDAIESITGTVNGTFVCPTEDTLPAVTASPEMIIHLMIYVNGDVAPDACNFTKLEQFYPPESVKLEQIQFGRVRHNKYIRIHLPWHKIDLTEKMILWKNDFDEIYSYGSLKWQIALWIKDRFKLIEPPTTQPTSSTETEQKSTTSMTSTTDPALVVVDKAETTVTTTGPISTAEKTTVTTTTTLTTRKSTDMSTGTTEWIGERTVPTEANTVVREKTVSTILEQRESTTSGAETLLTTTTVFPGTSMAPEISSHNSTAIWMTTTGTPVAVTTSSSNESTLNTVYLLVEKAETTASTTAVFPLITNESTTGNSTVESSTVIKRQSTVWKPETTTEKDQEDGMVSRVFTRVWAAETSTGTVESTVETTTVAGHDTTTVWKSQSIESTSLDTTESARSQNETTTGLNTMEGTVAERETTTGESTKNTTVLLVLSQLSLKTSPKTDGQESTNVSTTVPVPGENTVETHADTVAVWKNLSTESTGETSTGESTEQRTIAPYGPEDTVAVWNDQLTVSTTETSTLPSSEATVTVSKNLSTTEPSTVAIGAQSVQSTESTQETTTVPSSEDTVAVQPIQSTSAESTEKGIGFMVFQQRDPIRADRTSSIPVLNKRGQIGEEATSTTEEPGAIGLWLRQHWIWLFITLIVLLMLLVCIAICIAGLKKKRGVERKKKDKQYQKLGRELFVATKTAREMPRSHHSSSVSLESSNSLMSREGEHALLVPKEPRTESTQKAPTDPVPLLNLPLDPTADVPVPHPEEGAVDPFSPALPSPFEVRDSEVALTPVKTTSSFAPKRPQKQLPKMAAAASPTEKEIFNM